MDELHTMGLQGAIANLQLEESRLLRLMIAPTTSGKIARQLATARTHVQTARLFLAEAAEMTKAEG
jgi:hypothetical protein